MGLAVAPSRKNGLSVFQGSSIKSHAKNTWLNLPARSVRTNFGSIRKLVAHRFWHQRQKLLIARPLRLGLGSVPQLNRKLIQRAHWHAHHAFAFAVANHIKRIRQVFKDSGNTPGYGFFLFKLINESLSAAR
jgi:hypothetical protein